jgi:hypothetical protein
MTIVRRYDDHDRYDADDDGEGNDYSGGGLCGDGDKNNVDDEGSGD